MKNTVQKSIWLRQLGITMLNQADTPLSTACRYMTSLFGAETVLMYLREADEEARKAILIYRGCASMYSLSCEEDRKCSGVIDKVLRDGGTAAENGLLGVPMSCSQADRFGVLVFSVQSPDLDGKKEEAVHAFSTLVYLELMGGFLQSSHETVLEVRNVCVRYSAAANARSAVDHVSLDIQAGELTVIMGKSGCGKSSLINVIAGLLTPQSGEVLWGGENICTMKGKRKTAFRRDSLGYIFQNYNLIGELTAEENIAVAAILSGRENSVKDVLALVGLDGKEKKYPRQMSGGEQQRVAIARALVKNASLLLCDEPTGALDTENAKHVMCLLQRIAREQVIPVIVVTHNPDFSILADHYIRMSDGQVVEEYYCHFPYAAEDVL